MGMLVSDAVLMMSIISASRGYCNLQQIGEEGDGE